MVYVRAADVGLNTRLAPEAPDRDQALQAVLEEIRCQAVVLLGLAPSVEAAHGP